MEMAGMRDTYKNIHQNLIDAGCNKSLTEQCMQLLECGRVSDILSILAKHRKNLLESVYAGQR